MDYHVVLREKASAIWDLERRHPMVLGIGDGTLHMDRFRYFMMQDYVFLVDFCRSLALAAAKADDVEDMAWFVRMLGATINTEMSLHIGFCRDLGITEDALRATRSAPTTSAYTRHLIERGYSGDAGEIGAALLPCSWGYAEIGQMLKDRGLPDHKLYRRWIEMYASDEFDELAVWLRSFVDRAADAASQAGRDRMERAFLTSSRYEYMLWEACYRLEEWPA